MEKFFTEERVVERSKEFYTNFDAELEKMTREKFSVTLRKKNRDKYMMQKRANYHLPTLDVPDLIRSLVPEAHVPLQSKLLKYLRILNEFSSNVQIVTYCIHTCRSYFNKKKFAELYISLGFVDLAISLIKRNIPDLTFECTWLLLNIASGDHKSCLAMKEKHTIETCIWLLGRKLPKISENCLWCLSNLCSGNEEICKYLIDLNIFEEIVEKFQIQDFPNNKHGFLVLANVCAYENCAEKQSNYLTVFTNQLFNHNKQIVPVAMSGISSLISNPINTKWLHNSVHTFPKILEYSMDSEISLHALKLISKMIYVSNEYIEIFVNLCLFSVINYNLTSISPSIKKECLHIIYNVLVGTQNQNRLSIIDDSLLKKILDSLLDSLFEVRFSAWEVFLQVSQFKNRNDLYIIEELTFYMQKSLESECEPGILLLILSTFKNFLENSQDKIGELKKIFLDSGCVEEIGKKKFHGNAEVAEEASQVLNLYFDYEELHGIKDSDEEIDQETEDDAVLFDFS